MSPDVADTRADLDALPWGSVVLDPHGRAFQKFTDGWGAAGLGGVHEVTARPATVLYRSDAPSWRDNVSEDEQVRPGVDEIADQIRGPWFDEQRFSAEAIAACVDALYAAQPTIAEVKAEAWAEAVADLATALDEFKQEFPEATEQAKGVERAGNFLIRRFGLDEWLRVRTDPANAAQMTPSEDSPRGRTPRHA